MSGGGGLVFPLAGNQLLAADPEDNVWLSASAGTGKTQVLSARVLRLLLREDVAPSQILCLTFTKAGAAEMANRINAVLARWVRLPETKLFEELGHLGAPNDPATRERARSLFASVLDCPGGGLRIDTIHAFAQFLIGNFPEEAGLAPGTRVMDDRSRELLAREVLTDLVEEAERTHDVAVLDGIRLFTTRKDPSALHGWLMRAADAQDLWKGPGSWQSPMIARVRQTLGMPADAGEEWASEVLHRDLFPDDILLALLPALEGWKAKTGQEAAAFVRHWLSLDLPARVGEASRFRETLLKKDGEPRKMEGAAKLDPLFTRRQEDIAEALREYEDRRALVACADIVASALEIGRAFALRWETRKAREGLLEFGDLIRKAASLLGEAEAADWIRYKLDRHFDHILIDEAQDTNQSQWDIVEALIDDFFSGEGARGDKLRTIFTVGDYKQAIFGFQGTSPENFARAKSRVHARITAAREGIAAGRVNRRAPGWQDLDLGQSFRTADIVLGFVNRMIDLLGFPAFGLDRAPAPHVGAERPGLVTLWPPVVPEKAESEAEDDEAEEAGERDWLPRHDTLLAERIAEQVRRWVSLEDPFVLAKGTHRYARAGDIMVLVRQRKELAAQIVAKLYAKGVPVAGVDRLRLGAPLAVRDVLAALRFAAQPQDDLSLASLLASPLIGWTQDDILAHVPRPEKVRLWDHLRRKDAPPEVAATAERLRDLLRRADYQTPQALIAWLLTGPWQGRARLVERLGAEANDPLDELINAAFSYEAEHWPSLAGFIAWFDAGTGDLKRDSGGGGGQVRVMTVHGSKGLQAPIVILADATGAPGDPGDLSLEDDPFGLAGDRKREVPLPPLGKEERKGRIAEAEEAKKAAALQEHWRLLYVALTRAEEALFIGGSLNKNEAKKGVPHEDSWYARLAPLFVGEELSDPVWHWRQEWGERAGPLVPDADAAPQPAQAISLPGWVTTPIGPEPRPPRPLAPSSAGEDTAAAPPLPPEAARDAARRGSLIHALLERLPDVPAHGRAEAARAWLARQASDLEESAREEMLAAALGVLDHPDFAVLFSPGALAEVPLAATVDGVVVAGTADRLLIGETSITVVDFKTTRRPPGSAEEIPLSTLRQMAAYVAALEAIHPGRTVRAGVLYTHAPVLFEIAPEVIAAHKHALQTPQQSLPLPDIE
ncbi:double-strand break repair helicase AddA [Porphyrobacter sp. CACIAM 03H1]|uniref:double-strand break repair helicase AddA n=1 Tax=Porphyrobacter sp. CACIAM 03H1 TaxID=2003315 RepID=UPI000B5A6B40|nr:double-strand break repair helicase AddA [Porphyrobacter sp. CACIAM 03H1]ASJ91133.1 double-strand break repair helicase AddA [Porphyrobacter sp. CACIAM 03H1]